MKIFQNFTLKLIFFSLILAFVFIGLNTHFVSAHSEGDWTNCVNENNTCAFTGTRQVRFGDGNGPYKYLTRTNSVQCDYQTFGDPEPGISKHCDYSEPKKPCNENEGIPQCVIRKLIETLTGEGNAGNLFLWAVGISALAAFGILTYAGVLWSLSGGGEEKYKAMEMIKGAGYGLLIIIGGYTILYTINPHILGF